MTRQPDIWSRLQEYETPPPQGVFDKVCALVNLANPKETGKEEDNNDNEQMNGKLERLRHFEIQPPAILRSSIESLISGAAAPKRGFLFYGIRSAAACLLLALAGWLFYRVTISQRASIATLNKKNTTGVPSGKNAAVQQPDSLSGKDSLSKTDSFSEGNALADNLSARDSNALPKAGKYKRFLSFSFNGQRLPLADIDLLITFASLKYNQKPTLINHSYKGRWKIDIGEFDNDFSYKMMSEMKKEMSLFKLKGNPTRKARKSREKLDKWKRADEMQFDQSLKNNPLDPLDLGEFIFK